jgi:phosphohistidine phosphatase
MTTPRSERTLIMVRHSKAEHVQGKPDHDRELAPRGRRDARAIGEWLRDAAQAGALPTGVLDLALCSTSERTRQTLDGLVEGGGKVRKTRYDERIYDASTSALLEVLLEVPDSANSVVIIGHAPGIPALATALLLEGTGTTEAAQRLAQGFPTSGLAVLGFQGRWAGLAPGSATLREFAVPRG